MGKYAYLTDIKEILDEYEGFIQGESSFCSELLAMQMDELTNKKYIKGRFFASPGLIKLIITKLRLLWVITIVKQYRSDELDCLFYDIYHSLKKAYDGRKCSISRPNP